MHLIGSRAVNIFFSLKRFISLHACATCSVLPYNISAMDLYCPFSGRKDTCPNSRLLKSSGLTLVGSGSNCFEKKHSIPTDNSIWWNYRHPTICLNIYIFFKLGAIWNNWSVNFETIFFRALDRVFFLNKSKSTNLLSNAVQFSAEHIFLIKRITFNYNTIFFLGP